MFGVRPGATFAESSMPAGVGAARGDGKVPRRTATMKAHLVFLYPLNEVPGNPEPKADPHQPSLGSRYVGRRTLEV
jgi:hypothetical protein